MTSEVLTIGRAPDYVLKSGAILYQHRVTIAVRYHHDGRVIPIEFSHRSLAQLIKETKRRFSSLAPHCEGLTSWRYEDSFSTEIGADLYTLTMRYILPVELNPKQLRRLRRVFAMQFDTI